jgi:hypothetical protein
MLPAGILLLFPAFRSMLFFVVSPVRLQVPSMIAPRSLALVMVIRQSLVQKHIVLAQGVSLHGDLRGAIVVVRIVLHVHCILVQDFLGIVFKELSRRVHELREVVHHLVIMVRGDRLTC